MKRSISSLLALALLALAFVPASAASCSAQYTVKAGDNLFRISLVFNVPWPQIAAANSLANPSLIFPGQVLCIPGPDNGTPAATPTLGPSATPAPSATPTSTPTPGPAATAVPTSTTPVGFVIPTFTIVSVVQDTSVTIQTANFPANDSFDVTMAPIGNAGVGGFPVTTTASGAGGTFTVTYTLPPQLAGTLQIAIRLQSASGYYSFNWFYNVSTP